MFSFVKKLFEKQPEQTQTQSLSLEQIKELLNAKIKEVESDHQDQLGEVAAAYSTSLGQVRDSLQALAEAELQNKNMPGKALQYMTGNKESYHRLVSQFLSDVTIDDQTTLTRVSLELFCTNFKERIEAFTKSSLRNYQILQQFFSNEVGKVAQALKQLETAANKIKTVLSESELGRLEKALRQVEELEHYLGRKDQQEKRLTDLEEMKKKSLEQLDNAKKQLESFMNSPQVQDMKQMRADHKQKEQELRGLDQRITTLFSPIEKALKKYEKIAMDNQELVTEYVYRPEQALLNDNALGILPVLQHVKRNIESDTIELHEKKKAKALDAIAGLTQHQLETLRKQRKEKEQEVTDCLKTIKTSGVVEQHNKLNEQVAYHQEDVDKHEKELGRVQGDTDFSDEGQRKEEIEKTAGKELGISFTLVTP